METTSNPFSAPDTEDATSGALFTRLLPIFLTVFIDVLGLTLVLPLLPFYAEHFGASPFIVGTLSASYAVCQLFAGPVLGRISDRVGRKPVLLVSQMGTFIAFLMIGSAQALWMLFVGRIIDGLTAGNLSIAQAYISDVTKPEERTKAFGVIGISFGVGFMLGPAISGVLAHRFGFGSPAYAAAAASFTSIIVTWRMLPRVKKKNGAPTEGRSFAFSRFFSRPDPRRRLAEFFCFVLSFSTLIGGLALFLERRLGLNVKEVGYVYAFSGLVGAVIQGRFIGKLAKSLGEVKLALVGFVAMGVGYVLLGFTPNLGVMLLATTIASFGSAVTRPALTTLLTKSVGPDEQGAALGLSQSLASIAQIAGPLTAGALIDAQALTTYGIVAGVVALIGAVLLISEKVQPAPQTA